MNDGLHLSFCERLNFEKILWNGCTNLLVDRSIFHLQMFQFLKLVNIDNGILHGAIF